MTNSCGSGWKVFLPLSLAMVVVATASCVAFRGAGAMSPYSLIGLAIGSCLLGGISYGMLRKLGGRVDKAETKTLLNTVALIELVTRFRCSAT